MWSIASSDDPLPGHRVFHTRVQDEFRDSIIAGFGGRDVHFHDQSVFDARGSLAALKEVELAHGYCSNGVSIGYPESDYFRFISRLDGRSQVLVGRQESPITEGRSAITSAEQPFRIQGSANHNYLTLRVRKSALERRFLANTGKLPKGTITFPMGVDNEQPVTRRLISIISLITLEIGGGTTDAPLYLAKLEDIAIEAFLGLGRWNWLSEPDVSASGKLTAGLAADFIEANWERHVNVEELAAVTNVGVRTVFRAFRAVYGCSPLEFAKRCRLRKAREMLLQPAPGTTVTMALLKCGFANLGHFAGAYKEMFGELPSASLRRGRRNVGLRDEPVD